MRRTVQKRIAAAISVIVLLPSAPFAAAAQDTRAPLDQAVSTRGGTVTGTVSRDNAPIADARLQLREVTSGQVVQATRADEAGHFTFLRVAAGSYLVELVDEHQNVIAVGRMFSLGPTETIATSIRLAGAGTKWYGGFFSNAAAAAVAAAVAIGVGARGNGGQPASGRS